QWSEPAGLLLVATVAPEDLGIPRVRRLGADAHRREGAASEDLVDEDVVHEGDARAPRLRREMERPVAERFRALLHLTNGGGICRPRRVELPAARRTLQRVDVLVHEATHAVAQALDLLGNREIHRGPSRMPIEGCGVLTGEAPEGCPSPQRCRARAPGSAGNPFR